MSHSTAANAEADARQSQITITILSRSRGRAHVMWNITGDYYKSEARQDFWGEASLWVVLALTAFLPLISNAHAVMEFVRAISSY